VTLNYCAIICNLPSDAANRARLSAYRVLLISLLGVRWISFVNLT